SLNMLTPGINGPTSLAAIRNADDDLARIRSTLDELGLLDTTDIIATSDHGFSTISKESQTSSTVKTKFADTLPGHLPLGFVALDLAHALNCRSSTRTTATARLAKASTPRRAMVSSAAIATSRRWLSRQTAARI